MAKKSKISLKSVFSNIQRIMKVLLEVNQDSIKHPVEKGTAAEVCWKNFLRQYLPQQYAVDSAIIINAMGEMSEQIDIVIYDALHTPYILNQDNFKYIPIECVYAIFEVKQVLNRSTIEYACNKYKSVKQLGDVDITRGILCSKTGLKNNEKIKEVVTKGDLQLGCAIDKFFENNNGDCLVYDKETNLMSFIFILMKHLRSIEENEENREPNFKKREIDFDEYLRNTDVRIPSSIDLFKS